MTEYCRLCAELKDSWENVASISEVEQKLRACCCFTNEDTDQNRLPHSVCSICLDRLDKCWLFAQSVQSAQQRLLGIFQETDLIEIETKPLPAEILPTDYGATEYSKSFPSASNVQNDSHQQQGCDGLIEFGTTEVNCKPTVADWNLDYHAENDENSTIDNDSNASEQNSNHFDQCKTNQQHDEDTFKNQIKAEIKSELDEIETEQIDHDCLDPLASNENDEKSLSCQICGDCFATVNLLIKHLQKHNPNIKLHPCDVCGKSFNRSSNLVKHKRSVHQGIRPFECKECGRCYTCSRSFKNHMVSHGQGVRSHKCMECGKCFISNARLKEHLVIHSGEKAYKCLECGKRFVTNTQLKVHAVVHTGERAYNCDLCGKSFTQLPNLLTHKKAIHHGIRPFECKECGRHFTCNSKLKTHLITHTRLKPFTCDLCRKVFAQSKNLKRHKLKYCKEGVRRRE